MGNGEVPTGSGSARVQDQAKEEEGRQRVSRSASLYWSADKLLDTRAGPGEQLLIVNLPSSHHSRPSLRADGALVCKRAFESADARGLERRARLRDKQVIDEQRPLSLFHLAAMQHSHPHRRLGYGNVLGNDDQASNCPSTNGPLIAFYR